MERAVVTARFKGPNDLRERTWGLIKYKDYPDSDNLWIPQDKSNKYMPYWGSSSKIHPPATDKQGQGKHAQRCRCSQVLGSNICSTFHFLNRNHSTSWCFWQGWSTAKTWSTTSPKGSKRRSTPREHAWGSGIMTNILLSYHCVILTQTNKTQKKMTFLVNME